MDIVFFNVFKLLMKPEENRDWIIILLMYIEMKSRPQMILIILFIYVDHFYFNQIMTGKPSSSLSNKRKKIN